MGGGWFQRGLFAAAVFAVPAAHAAVGIFRVTAGEKVVDISPAHPPSSRPPIQIPYTPRPTVFHFGGDESNGRLPIRLRYRLDGVDSDWQDMASRMTVLLRLGDDAERTLAGDAVDFRGESPEWNGDPRTTPLIAGSMTFVAPVAASRVLVIFVSDSQPPTTGQLVVETVRLRHIPAVEPSGRAEVFDMNPVAEGDHPHAPSDNWRREGSNPSVAQLIRRAGSASASLMLNDTDPTKAGAWRSRAVAVTVAKGDELVLEWTMAHTIGSGRPGTAGYPDLQPGKYWFRVASVHANGLPTGIEASLPVAVMPPLNRRPEFWMIVLTAFAGLTALATRHISRRRFQARLEAIDRQRMLEAERARIARDIHDDLGATLAQIAMLSEIARTESGADPSANRQRLNDIFALAAESTRKVNEIIWAINPTNDTLEHFVRYLGRFAERHLQSTGIRLRFDAPDAMPERTLTSIQRHNLYLAAKEAIHNAVKHSGAMELSLRIRLEGDRLEVRIRDNGRGFDEPADSPPGRGSANMKHRMEQIGGSYRRTSAAGEGTGVELTCPAA